MKHLLFLTILSAIGTIGAVVHPFYGVLLYYMLAVLRPQSLWGWALPDGIRWSLLAAVATMLGLFLSLPRIMLRLRWNSVATLLLMFACCILMSTVNAVDQSTATFWAVEYGKIFVMALIATIALERLHFIRYLSWMVLLALGYIAWNVNSLYFFDGRIDIYHSGFGGLDNNGAGLMIAMGIPFAYACARHVSSYAVKLGCLLLGLFMLHAVMMTYSRGAMLATGIAMVWMLAHHRPRLHAAALAGGLMLAVVILAGPEIRARFFSIGDFHQDGSAQSRFDSWQSAWDIMWDYPLTGAGVRNSAHLTYTYGNDHPGQTIHSQYLQVGADSGIIAMLVYIAMCVVSLWNLTLARRHMLEARNIYRHAPPQKLPVGLHSRGPTDEFADIALAMQASLLTFVIGGMFLSLEVFELPWLLFTIAGAMPQLAAERYPLGERDRARYQRRLGQMKASAVKPAVTPAYPPPRPRLQPVPAGITEPTV